MTHLCSHLRLSSAIRWISPHLKHVTPALLPTLSAPRFSSLPGPFVCDPQTRCIPSHCKHSLHETVSSCSSCPVPGSPSRKMPWKSHMHSRYPGSLTHPFHHSSKVALERISNSHHRDGAGAGCVWPGSSDHSSRQPWHSGARLPFWKSLCLGFKTHPFYYSLSCFPVGPLPFFWAINTILEPKECFY